MLRSAIFDLDGLLIDSETVAYHVDRDILRYYGYDFTLAHYAEKYSGRTILRNMTDFIQEYALPITVDIPQNGKDIVKVEIYVGDEPNPQYSETVYEADGAVSTTLYGTGRKMVKVYFDGVLDQKQSYERSFG